MHFKTAKFLLQISDFSKGPHRIKIRLVEGNVNVVPKRGHVKGLCGRCLSVRGPASRTSPHPLTHCIRVYSTLIHTGKGGRVEPERRVEYRS